MDYKKHYNNLITSRKNRILDENEYYEKHHIIPKALNGTNDIENLVHLTAREHFIAHWLLYKMAKNTNEKIKTANAINRMRFSNKYQNKVITARQFEIGKKIFIREWKKHIYPKLKYNPPKDKEKWRKNVSLRLKKALTKYDNRTKKKSN